MTDYQIDFRLSSPPFNPYLDVIRQFVIIFAFFCSAAPTVLGQQAQRYPLGRAINPSSGWDWQADDANHWPSQVPQPQQHELALSPLPPLPDSSSFARSHELGITGDAAVAHSTPVVPFQHSINPARPDVPKLFVASANQTATGSRLLSESLARSQQYRLAAADIPPTSQQPLPLAFKPWWDQVTDQGILPGRTLIPVSLDQLIHSALQNAPNIRLAATEPHIRRTSVFEESAQFDWLAFLESRYDDSNDPVGNELTTGDGSSRFTQQEWFSRSGIRRNTRRGGEFELTQRLGTLDNNSIFLIPPDQGNSRLELNYRHPLLQGRGKAFNESLIVLAEIDFQASGDDFLATLQTHLADVTESYWELVRARAEYRQRDKLLLGAQAILDNLVGRSEVDALDRQIFRAQAAVAQRRAEITRSIASIKNAESRLKLLVNDPQFSGIANVEFIPLDVPSFPSVAFEMADVVSTALTHRPDISKAIRDISSANVRLGVSKNELLPRLDFLVGSYVAGLDGDFDVFNSWLNQFRDGRPGFNVGFDFELPIGNRAARARQQRRQWEANRSLEQFRVVVESSITEVEIAAREVQTTQQEIYGRSTALLAAANETNYLIDRWKTLPEVDDSVTLLLENLLDSQERQTDEEAALARAQFNFAVAVVRLKQSMGTLFQAHNPQ